MARPLDFGIDDRARVMGRANSGERSYLSTYDNEHTQQYNRYAEEAKQKGITDPAAIDSYASAMNRQYWSDQSNTGQTWLDQHPWMAPVGVALAGYGAATLGGSSLFGGAAGETSAGAGVGDTAGELSYASDPLAGAPTDTGPLTQYAQAPGPASDVTVSDVNNADLSNINNPGAPAPEPTSSPLQASQDPLGSGGDPGTTISTQPSSTEDQLMQQMRDRELGSLGGQNVTPATSGSGGTTVMDFINHPLDTLGNLSLGQGVLGAASLANMIGSYQARKKQKQQQADAIAAQQTRQNQINVNPNTGGANPIPNSRTQYFGTPNFNPFISQGPQDRLAFGPSPWQLGAPGQPPGGQARGGLAGMNMRDPAQGALSLARGPGGGQDDKIPALLSDGEYVMDAGVVADLGDGSTKEGARRLDKLRQNLRMHKRSAPAASIPPKAKSPASYLRGKV